MKKILTAILAFATVISLTSCAGAGGKSNKKLIGVSMPTQSLQRWNQDGTNMKKALESKGYQVELQYANNDENTQGQQIENMIAKQCKVVVIAAVNGSALTTQLQKAKDAGVKVVAYDRLLMNSENVDYYATFDNYGVGVLQGQYLESSLGLKEGKGPFNIEIFAGDPADNNATFFYKGAMSVLQPYIDSGKLVVKSGQTDFEKCAIQSWDSGKAQARMDNLITANYTKGTKLDAILSPNDSLAVGIVASLKSNGFGTGDKKWPLLTGQDCDKPNVKALVAGQQSMDIFKDTRKLADSVVSMVDALLQGKSATVNNTKDYNNGKKIVPSYLLQPTKVTKDNYKQILILSGYYTQADIS